MLWVLDCVLVGCDRFHQRNKALFGLHFGSKSLARFNQSVALRSSKPEAPTGFPTAFPSHAVFEYWSLILHKLIPFLALQPFHPCGLDVKAWQLFIRKSSLSCRTGTDNEQTNPPTNVSEGH